MIRLFYGLAIPPALVQSLTLVQNGIDGVRWVDPANFHITLRFVGEIDEDVARDLDLAVAHRLETRPIAPLTITVRGLGTFGDGHRSRTIWAGVVPTPEVRSLQQTLEKLCQQIGLEPDHRAYHPHITLGTHRNRQSDGRMAERIAPLVDWPVGTFVADQVLLYCSHLSPSGATYEDIASVPLTG